MRNFLAYHYTFMRDFLPYHYTFMRDFCHKPTFYKDIHYIKHYTKTFILDYQKRHVWSKLTNFASDNQRKDMAGKLDYEYCRAAPVLEWMSRKWALVVLLRIEEGGGELRFGDLFRTIPQISEKVLADTLDYLEGEGLATREAIRHVPPHVSYRLTPLAESFLREISYVIEWGQLHFDDIERGRKKHEMK